MKRIALILALLLAVPSAADARCFLFFCWAPHRTHTRVHPGTTREENRFCKGVLEAWTKLGPGASKGNFIFAFPPDKQDAVRQCLGG